MTTGYLGLGSNLGERLASLQRAVDLLDERGAYPVRSSRVYATDPVGGPPQGEYLNAVIEVDTALSPRDLLAACTSVEDDLGRVRAERWGPRVIDVDILTLGDAEVDEPDLRIPHPRMHERWFVLAPLLELAADPPLPGGRRVGTLRLDGRNFEDVRVHAPPLRMPG
ncbi:MAG: 2-amino-4-hydroxy-6-hydroxymethyldihydropteridine diphosphokinase [Actinomycetota bacterium]|nr:2-amino-4-hydroxy-6-hydroxymethyldihydropteridine diphosphokinase [Actinomycetota bacterium]